jgi:hypothetical protein
VYCVGYVVIQVYSVLGPGLREMFNPEVGLMYIYELIMLLMVQRSRYIVWDVKKLLCSTLNFPWFLGIAVGA